MPNSGYGGVLVYRIVVELADWILLKMYLGPTHWYDKSVSAIRGLLDLLP